MVLVFDGYCGVCTRLVRWIRMHDRHQRVQALPNQLPGLIERYGLSQAQVQHEVWLIEEDGRRYSGAEAVFRLLETLDPPWAWAATLYRNPLVKRISEPSYQWFSRHRHWFARWGGKPECADPDRGCLPP